MEAPLKAHPHLESHRYHTDVTKWEGGRGAFQGDLVLPRGSRFSGDAKKPQLLWCLFGYVLKVEDRKALGNALVCDRRRGQRCFGVR